jgi:hypothetical protein
MPQHTPFYFDSQTKLLLTHIILLATRISGKFSMVASSLLLFFDAKALIMKISKTDLDHPPLFSARIISVSAAPSKERRSGHVQENGCFPYLSCDSDSAAHHGPFWILSL